jgi:hypothetical protein
MDTFIYSLVDKSLRTGETYKIKTLGPYAKLLGNCLFGAAYNRKDLMPFGPPNKVSLYRATNLSSS